MGAHARLGPSNARWPSCPGSVREEANYQDIPSEAAIDGTGSHLLLEMCLGNNVPAEQYDQQIIGANHPEHLGGWLVGIERIQRVQMCLDYTERRVEELVEEYPGTEVMVEAESRSNPGGFYGRDDWWGTVDITITVTSSVGDVIYIEVIDYKDGRGWVNVKDNTQLVAYLSGKILPHVAAGTVKDCRLTIVQPKTNPVVRYQCSKRGDTTVGTVLRHSLALSKSADATDDPDAPTRSGKHCQWCKASPKRGGHCVTATEKSIQAVTSMSNTELVPVDVPMFEYISKVIADPKSLTSAQLGELLSAKDALMAAFDGCAAEIQSRIEAGQTVNGYAMQAGRSSRKWAEPEEEIVKKLKSRKLKLDEIYPKKLISPAALLKLGKLTESQKKRIEKELVADVAGKLTLKKVAHCPTDDVDSVRKMFADVPASTETASAEPTFL